MYIGLGGFQPLALSDKIKNQGKLTQNLNICNLQNIQYIKSSKMQY